MAIRIQYRRMSGCGELHHITDLKGTNDSTGQVDHLRSRWVAFVKNKGQEYVRDSLGEVACLRWNKTSNGTEYVETKPDHTKRDNLLRLPLY